MSKKLDYTIEEFDVSDLLSHIGPQSDNVWESYGCFPARGMNRTALSYHFFVKLKMRTYWITVSIGGTVTY